MTVGIVDSTVIIHYFRKNPNARAWVDAQPLRLSVTPITWLEVMHGAPGKAGQATCKAILAQFDMAYFTISDMDWAMQQMERWSVTAFLMGSA
jgi:predicted nucleic acid-binding protein